MRRIAAILLLLSVAAPLGAQNRREALLGARADKRRKLYNGMIKCDLYMFGMKSKTKRGSVG